jgi:hypothetical protein
MIRAVLSALLFATISGTLSYNKIDFTKASYWVIMGCAISIAVVFHLM